MCGTMTDITQTSSVTGSLFGLLFVLAAIFSALDIGLSNWSLLFITVSLYVFLVCPEVVHDVLFCVKLEWDTKG